jgi:hypothetical protein
VKSGPDWIADELGTKRNLQTDELGVHVENAHPEEGVEGNEGLHHLRQRACVHGGNVTRPGALYVAPSCHYLAVQTLFLREDPMAKTTLDLLK